MKSDRLRRTLTVAIFMALGLTVGSLFAQFGGGDGSVDNPYQIGRAEHLNEIRGQYLGANNHFIQTANINLGEAPWNQGAGWVSIGDNNTRFQGKFNGDGFIISGLTINNDQSYQGLFGYIQEAFIENVVLENVEISASGYIGALAGYQNNSRIVNCSSNGRLTGSNFWSYIGGLVGSKGSGDDESNSIINSYSTANVTGDFFVGGLLGYSGAEGIVENCWASGDVSGDYETGGLVGYTLNTIRTSFAIGNVQGGSRVGGLVGNSRGNIQNCYATGSVIGITNQAGGLCGSNTGTITNCYSTGRVTCNQQVGGLLGNNEGNVNNSYWNTETSGLGTSPAGEGRVTRQMVYPYDLQTTFINWDFGEIWRHDITGTINAGYPIISFQDTFEQLEAPEVKVEIVTIDNSDHFQICWELVERARSYRIYSSQNPSTADWGEPVRIVGEDVVIYIEPVGENRNKYFYVTASTQEVQ